MTTKRDAVYISGFDARDMEDLVDRIPRERTAVLCAVDSLLSNRGHKGSIDAQSSTRVVVIVDT